MVFENVTLFELHFDGARFGPGLREDGTDGEDRDVPVEDSPHDVPAEDTDVAGSGSPRRSRVAPALLALSVAIAAVAIVRRVRASGHGADAGPEEYDSGPEEIEIDDVPGEEPVSQ